MSVLIVQLQPWRALWLAAVLAAAGFAPAAVGLWTRGGAARAALALLVCAWLTRDAALAAVPLAAAALALRAWPSPCTFPWLAGVGLWAAVVRSSMSTVRFSTVAHADVPVSSRTGPLIV